MPSPLVVPVATISQITPHPNADSLEIASVLGWQCVVQKDRYRVNDRIVYFAPDTVIPKDLSDAWGVTQYLDKGRIKPTRLRGQPSFGLVMPAHLPEWNVGDNVAADFPGVTKYEPPTREAAQRGQGKFIPNPDHLPRDPLFPEYTHIANLRHYPDLLGPDEFVVVTEKLHGTNSRIGMIDGQWMAGSHRVRRGEGDAVYWSPRKHAEALVAALAKYHRQVVLYGEIVGSDVQSLDYGFEGHEGYAAFDLMIDGRYVDWQTFNSYCYRYSVPMVPCLYTGLFNLEYVREFSRGATTIYAERIGGETVISSDKAAHLREGVVVKPLIERYDDCIGRVILKFISDDYLLLKETAKHTDFAEV